MVPPSAEVGSAQLDANNALVDTVTSGFQNYDVPFYQGGFDYITTNMWTILGSGITNVVGPLSSPAELIDSSGDFSVTKYGVTITRSLDDVSYSNQ
jgi:hypothetical protein